MKFFQCGICKFDYKTRDEQVEHYKSKYHNHNLSLYMVKKSPLTLDEFQSIQSCYFFMLLFYTKLLHFCYITKIYTLYMNIYLRKNYEYLMNIYIRKIQTRLSLKN